MSNQGLLRQYIRRNRAGLEADGTFVVSAKTEAKPWLAAITLWLAMLAISTSGCATHQVLAQHTAAVNITVSDIYHQQVLNNLARFVVNPAAMPSFSVVNAGTVNVEDLKGASVGPNYSPTLSNAQEGGGALPILSILFGLNATRSITENWSTAPVTDSDNLRRMRCAFQLVVETEVSECDRCKERLKGFFVGGTESFECMMPTGWYNVGRKCDVPPHACYVAEYCGTYVWVMPEGLDGFTRFTITVLDIATGEIHAPQRTVVKKYNGAPLPGNLESTEVTSTEVDSDALKDSEKFQLDRERTEVQTPNRGLFFVPR